jgi:hypothetical protein
MKQGATLVPLANGRLYRLRHRHFSARARACTRVQFARGVVNVSSPGTGFRYRLQHAGALGDAEGAQPFNIRQQTSSDKYLVEECSRAVLLYFPLHARLLHTNILDLIFSRCLEVVAFKRCGILIPLYHTRCASLPSYPFC